MSNMVLTLLAEQMRVLLSMVAALKISTFSSLASEQLFGRELRCAEISL